MGALLAFGGEDTFAYAVTDGIGTSQGAVTVRVAERLFPVFVPVVARGC